ncbi:glutamate-tRNA ligase [Pneumocystis murina B123]|uniref:glutamate--tRNA ligase n=1 Tax=Pneumocystis murina (strain B123) TaxID=1069680 RepID=M7NSV9_PNEMU|nr:glutamate-tRNA ligase [Pneumocystis murina B123]EMR10362.1 glutamate-tRNA ligase [Pneumocystis murina B123]
MKGDFVLRIEDTDKTRIVKNSEKNIYKILRYTGIHWDEGPIVGGKHYPYKQSQRINIYLKYANILLESGNAYRCFCSIDRLEKLKKMSKIQGLSGTYDRNCMSIHMHESNERALKGDKFVLRFKIPEKYPVVHDIVYGDIDFSGPINIQRKIYDDPIIIKSDTFPTYHFANVVDDYLMNITHVIRGEEWLPSTSKHLAIYQAFGWIPPRFAHVSLLVNPDGSKISKRCNDTHIQNYIDEGYSSDALLNYVALIGWSPKTSNDVFTMQELIDRFSLDNLTKGTAIVMPEKLNFLNKQHFLRSTENEDGIKKIIKKIKPKIVSLYKKKILEDNDTERLEDEYIYKIILALRRKVQNINHLIESSKYFFVEPDYNEHILNEFKLTSKDLELTLKIIQELNKINIWISDEIISTITKIATTENIKIKKIKMILRFCCTASIVGADIIQIIYILGKKSVILRINKTMEWNKSFYHK